MTAPDLLARADDLSSRLLIHPGNRPSDHRIVSDLADEIRRLRAENHQLNVELEREVPSKDVEADFSTIASHAYGDDRDIRPDLGEAGDRLRKWALDMQAEVEWLRAELTAKDENEMRVLDWLFARAGDDENDDRYRAAHTILRTDGSVPLQDARDAAKAESESDEFEPDISHDSQEWMTRQVKLVEGQPESMRRVFEFDDDDVPAIEPVTLGWAVLSYTDRLTGPWRNRRDAELFIPPVARDRARVVRIVADDGSGQ